MTTYARPPVIPAQPPGAPPPVQQPPFRIAPPGPPQRDGRVPVLLASTVFVLSAAALVFTGGLLGRTSPAATDTDVMVPPAPPAFSAAEIDAAKTQACRAWASASTATTRASNAVAAAPHGFDDPAKRDALAFETRTILVETTYLRGNISAATPVNVASPIHDYLISTFDQEDATMRRMGSQVDAAIDRENAAAERIDSACGTK